MAGSQVVPLGRNGDALDARVELIDQAEATIDVQHYLLESSAIGYLILDRLLDAADHGVGVRILVDDLRFGRRTRAVASLCRHPHL